MEDGVTTISFTRKLDTGDEVEDISLSGTCVYLLWACGEVTPEGIVGHVDRGSFGMVCFPTEMDCQAGMLYYVFSLINFVTLYYHLFNK